MAKSKTNGHGPLEDALALLIQNQASLLARVSETDRELAEYRRAMAETNREIATRFAHIETMLIEHNRILPRRQRDDASFICVEEVSSDRSRGSRNRGSARGFSPELQIITLQSSSSSLRPSPEHVF